MPHLGQILSNQWKYTFLRTKTDIRIYQERVQLNIFSQPRKHQNQSRKTAELLVKRLQALVGGVEWSCAKVFSWSTVFLQNAQENRSPTIRWRMSLLRFCWLQFSWESNVDLIVSGKASEAPEDSVFFQLFRSDSFSRSAPFFLIWKSDLRR